MPECQAKFCTVVRGQGISTFSIPDPKKEYERCARWLHNLGNAKLDIKTFKHSFNMIVCEKHFEPSCFKEDMQAKVMGYIPKKKFLKDDAIPTIFADTKPIHERKSSKSRKEKMEKQELIETLLTGNENHEVEMQHPITPSVERKRKQIMPSISSKKSKVTSTYSSKTDCGIQVGPTYVDKSVSCNIITEIPTTHCTKCFERDNPSLAIMLAYVIAAIAAGVCLAYRWLRSLQTISNYEDRYVLITGCDTGFGNMLTKKLDKVGFHVFAGCLTREGMDKLQNETSPNVNVLQLDVSQTDSIVSAFQIVKSALPVGTGLWALVNNAGILGTVAPLEWIAKEDYITRLEVNTLGMVETSRVFLPLILRCRGRIINTTSMNGRFATPGNSTYVVSKFAAEGYSDALRRELYKRGVTVHIIEPGGFKTNIVDGDKVCQSINSQYTKISEELKHRYGVKFLNQFTSSFRHACSALTSSNFDLVINAYTHAVTSKYPKHRYLVGNDAKFIFRLLWNLPEWMSDYIIASQLPSSDAER